MTSRDAPILKDSKTWTETLCQMTPTKELLNFTSSPRTRIEPRPRTTGKRITRQGTSIPSKRWSMPTKLSSGLRKLIGSPRNQRGGHRSMKRMNGMASRLKGFSSGATLGGKVFHYRNKENIYKQGSPAYSLF